MSARKAKRLLNEADNYIIFTERQVGDEVRFTTYYPNLEAWEILLNLAVTDRYVRETFRNIIKLADENLANNGDTSEPEKP